MMHGPINIRFNLQSSASFICCFPYVEESDIALFYIHGSVHRESNLITVQQDATYSVHYISVGDQPRGLVVRVSDY